MRPKEMIGKIPKTIISKGREWIINEVKTLNLEVEEEQVFQLDLNGHLLQRKWVLDHIT